MDLTELFPGRAILNLKEVAGLLGLSEDGLRYRIRKGTGPPELRTGRSIVFRLDDVQAWIDNLGQEDEAHSTN